MSQAKHIAFVTSSNRLPSARRQKTKDIWWRQHVRQILTTRSTLQCLSKLFSLLADVQQAKGNTHEQQHHGSSIMRPRPSDRAWCLSRVFVMCVSSFRFGFSLGGRTLDGGIPPRTPAFSVRIHCIFCCSTALACGRAWSHCVFCCSAALSYGCARSTEKRLKAARQ